MTPDECQKYVPESATVPLELWQSLNREYERVAKALCKVTFEFERHKRETANQIGNYRGTIAELKAQLPEPDMECT